MVHTKVLSHSRLDVHPAPSRDADEDEPRRPLVAVDRTYCTASTALRRITLAVLSVCMQPPVSLYIHAAHELRLHSSSQSIHRDIRVCLCFRYEDLGSMKHRHVCQLAVTSAHARKGNIGCVGSISFHPNITSRQFASLSSLLHLSWRWCN